MTLHPDPAAAWWTTTDVAAYLGVDVTTVSQYRRRQQMPAPDETVGRTHQWRPARIIAWRPREGYTAPDRPKIHTAADLALWLDGYDTGAATVLRTLASLPVDALPAAVAHMAEHARAGERPQENPPGTSSGRPPPGDTVPGTRRQ